MAEQNFANHTKYFPPFHFFVMPVLLVNLVGRFICCGKQAVRFLLFFGVVFALALILGFLSARLFALTVQDRVIRLEEQLRYQRLLPADLQPRIGEFTRASSFRCVSPATRNFPRSREKSSTKK